jgi:MoaA/NifB/PqqE/SkfB family radical SAM enzyme
VKAAVGYGEPPRKEGDIRQRSYRSLNAIVFEIFGNNGNGCIHAATKNITEVVMAANREKELLNVHKNYYPKILRIIRNNIVKIIPENSWLFKQMAIVGFKITAKQKHKRRTSMKIDIPTVEHCNLSCKCCTAFSPLAKKYFLDVETYEKDMKKLAELTNGNLESVCFTGGEPLLHPSLTEMFDITRLYFKGTEISFMTNGVLLPKMSVKFWENCKKNTVCIFLSRYPIHLDIAGIKKTATSYGIKFDYVGGSNTPVKEMWKYPIDLHGKQKFKNSFYICNQVNSCLRIKNGVIYPCNTIACIEHFNSYFNIKLEVTKKDYININNIKSIDEIYDFLIEPKPFCKHCNRGGVIFGIKYGASKKEITEWI